MKAYHNKFNLIEILISMVVIIFSMFIILSFMPLAQHQQSQAINQTHLANFAQDMMDYIKSRPQDALSNIEDQFNFINNISSSKATEETSRSDFSMSTAVQENGSTKIYEHNSNSSIFLVRSENTLNGKSFKEAEIEIRLWKSPSIFHYGSARADSDTSPTINSTNNRQNYAGLEFSDNDPSSEPTLSNSNTSDPEDLTKQLYIRTTKIVLEFSWPINKSYEKREKETIFFDQQVLTKN